MSQSETLPQQQPAPQAETANQVETTAQGESINQAAKILQPIASNDNPTPPVPALASVGPTLKTTEDKLAQIFGANIPKDILPEGIELKLDVHMHDGKENLNLTFLTKEGFGLNAQRFSAAVNKIVHEIPELAPLFASAGEETPVAVLGNANTPQNNENALRFVLTFNKPSLIELSERLNGLKQQEEPQPAITATENTTETAEAGKQLPQPAEKPTTAKSEEAATNATPDIAPKAVVETPPALAERVEQLQKQIG